MTAHASGLVTAAPAGGKPTQDLGKQSQRCPSPPLTPAQRRAHHEAPGPTVHGLRVRSRLAVAGETSAPSRGEGPTGSDSSRSGPGWGGGAGLCENMRGAGNRQNAGPRLGRPGHQPGIGPGGPFLQPTPHLDDRTACGAEDRVRLRPSPRPAWVWMCGQCPSLNPSS